MNVSKKFVLEIALLPATRRGRLSQLLATYCRNYLLRFENCTWEPARNGEHVLLSRLSALPVRTVFDVGANNGDWAKAARTHFTTASIHCFEISPLTASALALRHKRDPGIIVNEFGLSSSAGTVTLAHFPTHDDNSRMLARHAQTPEDAQMIRAAVQRGDVYCAQRSIQSIDFLKIDTEGAEFLVLSGFSDMLKTKAIALIQFEHVSEFMLRNSHCLEDIFNLLLGAGYRIGRLFPRGVVEEAYEGRLERLPFAQYIAMPKECSAQWERLAYK